MKRDIDLCRDILLRVEAQSDPIAVQTSLLQTYGQEIVEYHYDLLLNGGFLRNLFKGSSNPNESPWLILLTWSGHEFLDAARSDTRWNQAKKMSLKIGGIISVEVMKSLLNMLVKNELGVLQ